MQRRECFLGDVGEQREMQVVGVEMQNVELRRALSYPMEHG
jgi:hypothetical protein